MKPLHVVAAIDPGRDDDVVSRVATSVAGGLGASVEFVAVQTPSFTDEMVENRLRSVSRPVPGATCTHLVDESVVAALLEYLPKSGADLVVLASHGRGAIGELFLGSVSADLVRSSPVPTVLVGGDCEPPAPIRHLAVAVDGSADALGALDVAAAIAHRSGLEIGLLEVATGEVPGGMLQESAEVHRLARHVDPPLNDWDVLHGADPARALIEHMRGVDDTVLVVGSHGRSPGRPRPLGGVAARIVRHATVPVLVVSPEAAQPFELADDTAVGA